jgi:hypothetical protein
MILGHLAIAGIAKRKFLTENFTFLLVASFGPDLIDKTLNLAFKAPGRGVGHSFLMFALLAAAAWLFCQRFRVNKQLWYIGVMLWSSHLITDVLAFRILFWPFLGPFPNYPHYTFMERLWNYYVIHKHSLQLLLEISFIIIAITLWVSYSLRRRLRPAA